MRYHFGLGVGHKYVVAQSSVETVAQPEEMQSANLDIGIEADGVAPTAELSTESSDESACDSSEDGDSDEADNNDLEDDDDFLAREDMYG